MILIEGVLLGIEGNSNNCLLERFLDYVYCDLLSCFSTLVATNSDSSCCEQNCTNNRLLIKGEGD